MVFDFPFSVNIVILQYLKARAVYVYIFGDPGACSLTLSFLGRASLLTLAPLLTVSRCARCCVPFPLNMPSPFLLSPIRVLILIMTSQRTSRSQNPSVGAADNPQPASTAAKSKGKGKAAAVPKPPRAPTQKELKAIESRKAQKGASFSCIHSFPFHLALFLANSDAKKRALEAEGAFLSFPYFI